MPSITSKTLLAAVAGATAVIAHGHVNNIVVNGVSRPGYDTDKLPYMQNPPAVVGWTTTERANGFVSPSAFGTSDIICHKGATNAGGHAVVAAGDKVFIQWNTWPESHHGPVIDYLANCGSVGCEKVDKTDLKFFKIDEVGLVSGTGASGTWGSDQLIANGNSWLVEIPPTIAPGFYVLRHEIIALHSANNADGAQNYPQCFNLQVTGGGSDTPAGVAGTALYGASDPAILVNIYNGLSKYSIPGPALYSGAVSVAQAKSVATATSTALTGSATGGAGSGSGSGAGATTTAAPTSSKNGGGVAVTATPTTPAVVVTPTSTLPAATVTTAPSEGAACPAPKVRTVTVYPQRKHARDIHI